jgi:hypothetical protein
MIRRIPRHVGIQDRVKPKKLEYRKVFASGPVSFLLINQMAKKTRKMRKNRRRTRRRRGGGLLPLPSAPAIEVSTAGANSDNEMKFGK